MAEAEKKTGGENNRKTAQRVEAVKKIVEAVVKENPQTASGTAANVPQEKKNARAITSRMTPDKISDLEAELRGIPKEQPVSMAEATQRLSSALSGAKDIKWLAGSTDDFQHNPDAAVFAARIAGAGLELQKDPHYLLAEGAKFFWSTKWAELSPDAHREARNVLKNIYNRVEALRAKTPDFYVDTESVIEALIPEARMSMRPRRPVSTTEVDYRDVLSGLGTHILFLPPEFQSRIAEFQRVPGRAKQR